MPHSPRPFFKQKRNSWYVEIDRVQHLLGKHPEDLPPPRKKGGRWDPPPAILAAFYKKMAEAQVEGPKPPPAKGPSSPLVLSVVEKFLNWCQEHRAPETYEWYRWRLQHFADSIDKNLTVDRLRHYHVDDALKKDSWSSGTKHGVARAVMRAMRWAKKKGHIEVNPVADYEKPRPGKRKQVISPEEFETILSLAGCQEFKDLLVFTWETAARPQESLVLEARHVDPGNARIVFPPDESKGEEWPRIIYLTDTALAIVKRLVLKHPEGPLFRNSDGVPWTTDAVNCAFIRLQARLGTQKVKELGLQVAPVPKLGRAALLKLTPAERAAYRRQRQDQLRGRRKQVQKLATQHGTKYSLYTLRHSWATNALARGVDALTVAILMGHRDPSTLAKVYQHLSQRPDYLREQARRAVS